MPNDRCTDNNPNTEIYRSNIQSFIFVVLTMIASFVICLVIFSLTLFQAVDALSFLAIGDWGGNEYFFWGKLCV